jgi:predicted DNA-binding transcriptional regulator AlpA
MKRLLNIKTVSRDRLSQSERKTWKDISSGRFGPHLIRCGRCVRVEESELDDWISAGCPPRDRWEALQATKSGEGRSARCA